MPRRAGDGHARPRYCRLPPGSLRAGSGGHPGLPPSILTPRGADTATGFIVTAVEGLAAEHYRRVISEKTRDALAATGWRPDKGWASIRESRVSWPGSWRYEPGRSPVGRSRGSWQPRASWPGTDTRSVPRPCLGSFAPGRFRTPSTCGERFDPCFGADARLGLIIVTELRTCLPTTIAFQDWEGAQDFQTLPHLPARTDDLFVSVMIRGFSARNPKCASGSARIETHDSVRVEFESSRAGRMARFCRMA